MTSKSLDALRQAERARTIKAVLDLLVDQRFLRVEDSGSRNILIGVGARDHRGVIENWLRREVNAKEWTWQV